MKVENLEMFDREVTFPDCVIITFPMKAGFLWLDSTGQLHNAEMDIEVHSGKVQVLTRKDGGGLSYGWYKDSE